MLPDVCSRELTLKPMSPFLQQRQANMRKTNVKRPEKEMATTAKEEGQDSSLSGVPSATLERCASVNGFEVSGDQMANNKAMQEIKS